MQDTISLQDSKSTIASSCSTYCPSGLLHPFLQSSFPADGPQYVLVLAAVSHHMQDFALLHIGLHKVPASPPLQLVQSPLDSSAALW